MSGTLPNWLASWLGVEVAPGEAAVWRIEAALDWPPWLALAVVAAAVVFEVRRYLREPPASPALKLLRLAVRLTVWTLLILSLALVSLPLLVACAAVGMVALVYRRENPRASRRYRFLLAAMRSAAAILVLLMVAQVALVLQRTGLPAVAVVLDDSLSMTVADRYEAKPRAAPAARLRRAGLNEATLSRWNLALALLTESDAALLRGLADDYKLRFYCLTGPETVAAADAAALAGELRRRAPRGEATRLGAGLRTVLDDLRGAAPAALVLVSDGVNTDGPPLSEAAALARRKGVPLFTVALGGQSPVRDLKLADLLVEDVAFVGDVLTFECRLAGVGFQGSKAAIVLREKDKPAELARVEIVVGPDGQSQTVRLPYRPTAEGRFQYVVSVEPQPDEQQSDNNHQEHSVQVRKEQVRVLLVQGGPSYEFRFLRNLLGRDETIALSTVLQDADPEYAAQDAAALRVFPVRRDELAVYDVLILSDADPALLGAAALQNIADFVEQPGKGGAVVFVAGPRFLPAAYRGTPLAKLFPFDLASVRYPDPARVQDEPWVVEPTELGLLSPGMQLGDTPQETRNVWRELPPLYWLLEAPETKPGVRVLAEHPTRLGRDGRKLPVFMVQYVGAGKVLFHASDETYRWRRRVGDALLARYWVQTLRWLARAKLAEGGRVAVLTTDQSEYQRGESVRLRVRFADERAAPAEDNGVTVVVEPQGRPVQQVQLHRVAGGRATFEGLLAQPPPGSYHARIAVPAVEGRAPAADFSVRPPAGEFERVQMDAAALRQAAEETKGRFYTIETADRLLSDLPPGRQMPVETLPPLPLWNRWPLLLAVLGLLIGEWILRKRGGMV